MCSHRCQGFTADTGPKVLPRDPGAVGGTRSHATSAVIVRPGLPRRKTHIASLVIRRLRQVVQDRLLPSARWADIPQLSIRDRRCPAAWQQYWQQSRPDGTDPRPSVFRAGHITGRRGSARRGPVADRASDLLGSSPLMPTIHSDAAHRARDLRGNPACQLRRVLAIGPRPLYRRDLSPHGCPQTVINFPGVTQMPAVTAVRAPTHCCSAGAHRQVAARIPTAPRAEAASRSPVFGHAYGRSACRWIPCSNAVDAAILRYCTTRRRGCPAPVARSSDARTVCQHAATVCGNAAGAGIMPG